MTPLASARSRGASVAPVPLSRVPAQGRSNDLIRTFTYSGPLENVTEVAVRRHRTGLRQDLLDRVMMWQNPRVVRGARRKPCA